MKKTIEAWIATVTTKGPEAAKALKALVDQYGGVGGFAQHLQSKFDREKIATWMKDGKDFVLSHDQVKRLLENDKIRGAAAALGTTQEKLTEQLTKILPEVLKAIEAAQKKVPSDSLVGKALSQVAAYAQVFFGGSSKPTAENAEKKDETNRS